MGGDLCYVGNNRLQEIQRNQILRKHPNVKNNKCGSGASVVPVARYSAWDRLAQIGQTSAAVCE